MESALKEHSEIVSRENKFIFENRNLEFYVGFDLDGSDYFQPDYCSTISIGISDKFNPDGELINLHIITIWECQRRVFSLPISKNIPGSKIIGEFPDESLEEIHRRIFKRRVLETKWNLIQIKFHLEFAHHNQYFITYMLYSVYEKAEMDSQCI